MLNYNLGYACINTELSSRKVKVSTNRTMRRKTFDEKGLDYVSEIILQNVTDLLTILEWNAENDINFFRMSSEMFHGHQNMHSKILRILTKLKKHYLRPACLRKSMTFVSQRIPARSTNFVLQMSRLSKTPSVTLKFMAR